MAYNGTLFRHKRHLKTTERTTDFANFENFSKLRTAVYLSSMAPIGAKLCQNAFQTIPDVSF